jgi:MarR family transcriptional regulator, organic hydroperoxide resistance regulator
MYVKRLRLDRVRYRISRMKNASKDREEDAAVPFADYLCFSVYSASHAFTRAYQPLLQKFDLTYPQYIALVVLWEKDGQTVGELGAKLFLQSNTLTPLLKRLEKLGYVQRSRDPADERQVRINLTEAGKKLRGRAANVPDYIRNATGLERKQIKQLMNDIGVLRAALDRHASSASEEDR